MSLRVSFLITGTSPSSASTAILGTAGGLLRFNWFTIHAALLGATGGTLNVYIQRMIVDDIWSDWLAFTQLTAAQAATRYTANTGSNNTISAVGGGTNAVATPSLSAGTFIGGHPGDKVRVVCTAGVSTSAGAVQSIYLVGHRVRS